MFSPCFNTFSVQESASIEVADELCLVGQSSKDYIPPSSNKDGFEETNETQVRIFRNTFLLILFIPARHFNSMLL